MDEDSFYRMRKIQRTPQSTFVNSQNVKAGLNVQHNCHNGGCELTETGDGFVERRKSKKKKLELTHTDHDQYIVNIASLSSAAWHRTFSEITFVSPGPLQWVNTLHDGLKKWGSIVEQKEKKVRKKSSTMARTTMDPSLM
ncbi:uncharacterized protein PGTG_19427 [Puccinia graminis f. sp. tritici CRL 75-36-700-3]|uniref:Uncharacterized protein n=1 Tax=Puccinia graminis f. sp. tritici (strain CRL 75-36-700-3 / race SCCL) TaxID=418459 RepID=E3L9G3_PUCGT|nr:uncharacterized protein PGTG_19427 [Puccinia graminis f. sp. tritici CRL 75-36-700-3]EFP93188.1 hypothetical protein PGTG_19427 [Puccinia graminis f. sp. tritici CRL 75-36-700-3]